MTRYLRQSTASQEVPLGYFLDSTDGNTEETGLTIANTDIKIHKTGATTLANKNSGGGTHISNGVYYAVLDATDTDTLGPLTIFVHVAGALAIKEVCCVLPANIFDSMILGTDLFDVNAAQLGGGAQSSANVGELSNRLATLLEAAPGSPNEFRFTADALVRALTAMGMAAGNMDAQLASLSARLPALVGGRVDASVGAVASGAINEAAFDTTAGSFIGLGFVRQGTAQSVSGLTAVLDAAAAFGDNALAGMFLAVRGSTQGYWQCVEIESNVGSTDTLTLRSAFQVAPTGTLLFKVLISSPGDSVALSIKAVTDKLNTTLETAPGSPGDYRFGADALSQAPSGTLTASGIRAAVGLGSANLDAQLSGIQSDTDNIQTRIPAALVSGRMDASVGAMAADVLTSSALAASAVTEIQTGLSTSTAVAALAVILAKLDTMLEVNAGSPTDYRLSADAVQRVQSVLGVAAANLDAQFLAVLARLPAALIGGRIDATVGAMQANVMTAAAAASDLTTELQTGLATAAAIAALNNLSAAQVNAEVVDALATDTYAEPAQGAPAATVSLAAKINFLYKFLRNRKTQTASQLSVFADDGSTVDHKATVSDDGTTTTVGEIAGGP